MIPPFQAAVIIQIVSGASIAPDAPVDRVLSDAALQALWQASRTGYPLMVAARKTAAKQSPAPVGALLYRPGPGKGKRVVAARKEKVDPLQQVRDSVQAALIFVEKKVRKNRDSLLLQLIQKFFQAVPLQIIHSKQAGQ